MKAIVDDYLNSMGSPKVPERRSNEVTMFSTVTASTVSASEMGA